MSVSGTLHRNTGLLKKNAIPLTINEKAIHCTTKMVVILFWKVELSPTYSNDWLMSIKQFFISSTTKTGFLY